MKKISILLTVILFFGMGYRYNQDVFVCQRIDHNHENQLKASDSPIQSDQNFFVLAELPTSFNTGGQSSHFVRLISFCKLRIDFSFKECLISPIIKRKLYNLKIISNFCLANKLHHGYYILAQGKLRF
ncbi:MAG: hypothetical protein RR356_03030 [Bacteroidales bacterium]